ncbi:MAG: GNAT family N-acetyltransferase [Clostridia bacterium]|nr:GNAT family N-acetyltransferase [Clostridia bacterium]
MKNRTRKTEEHLTRLFSQRKAFSEHLIKWEDNLLPDKYDRNCFEYSGQPTREEFQSAVKYQQRIGAGFIKLEGNDPLEDSFGLEAGVTLTMVLTSRGTDWKTNPYLTFRTPTVKELEEIEVKHFGPPYGEDFTKRNIRRQYEKLTYHGAYLGEKLVGSCYSFTSDGLICIDGLIVDSEHRKRYIATTLIARIKDSYPDKTLFLHADDDDTPKEMYKKMGFETVDRLYEYICTDISALGE